MNDDFFVLWRDADGGPQRRWLRVVLAVLLLLAVALGVGLPLGQRTISPDARFEYGTTREYEGTLLGEPVPLLVGETQLYFLVDPFKHGFDPTTLGAFDGRRARLTATLIERSGRSMLEVRSGSVTALDGDGEARLGFGDVGERVVLRGEIVDSKCYLGVMNPGQLKPHRACAINCLRGGIPPLLIGRGTDGQTEQILLVAAGDRALRDWILPYVAEPVEVEGRIRELGPLRVLELTSQDIRRTRNGD